MSIRRPSHAGSSGRSPRRGKDRPRIRSAVALLATVTILAGGAVAGAAAGRVPGRAAGPTGVLTGRAHPRRPGEPPPPGPIRYEPPVRAPVVDPFRAPATRYGPGNRGIEYATTPGTVVGAAGDGTVTFAGPVAGSLDVTVRHGDGIRTSYVGLATIDVRVGQHVQRGQQVGTTGSRFHIGARQGDEYLDPASLWSNANRAVLVPLDGGPTPSSGN